VSLRIYGNKFTDDGPYGKQRSASIDSKVVSDTAGGANIEVRRGDGESHFYQKIGASGGITTYQSYASSYSPSTVVFDGTDFTETLLDGSQIVYRNQNASDPGKHLIRQVRSAQGVVHTYAYGSGARVTYGYDPLGRRTTMVDWGGTTTYAYSARSELLGKTDPGGLVQAYRYDSAGNRVGLTDPDGGRITYTYDSLNRGATYQKPTNQLYTQQYDSDSRPTTLLMGLGTRELCQYDPVGRLTTLIQQKSDGTPILTVVDTYDAGGRKTVSTRDGVPATYSYDKASRLLGQDKAGQVATFSYDNTDNVLVKWHQGQAPISMSYDAANRRVTSFQGAATTGWFPIK
jgi:YD repeat-containing protein